MTFGSKCRLTVEVDDIFLSLKACEYSVSSNTTVTDYVYICQMGGSNLAVPPFIFASRPNN